jgi:hypothetical protein
VLGGKNDMLGRVRDDRGNGPECDEKTILQCIEMSWSELRKIGKEE